jgi:hypothetical protein
MIRGAIEFCTSDQVGGWIYSEAGAIRGRTVLAFVDDVCIGAGHIDQFRQDLLDAGLGDGYLGFLFHISIPSSDDASRVYVKLEGSDFALLQAGSKLSSPLSADTVVVPPSLRSEASLAWMQQRGWLTEFDFDLLKNLHLFGVYDVPLRVAATPDNRNGTSSISPEIVAANALQLLCLEDVSLEETTVSANELKDLHSRNYSSPHHAVVALWSPQRTKILVVEGSHKDFPQDENYSLKGAMHYVTAPDRLLFLDVRSLFGVAQDTAASVFRVFTVAAAA